jgi:protein-tyrosine phosphatase
LNTVLFLCTGNFYRSRFAELLFNALAERGSLDWRAVSRGIAIERGAPFLTPIYPAVLRELRARGLAPEGILPYPRQLLAEDLARADRIIALYEPEHRPLLAERFPGWQKTVEYWQVPDVGLLPASQGLAAIERNVRCLLRQLASS